MKVLLMSQNEQHAFLLRQLQLEGNEAMMLVRESTGSWEGIVDRGNSLQDALTFHPDVVIVDSPGFGPLVKRLRESELKVFGGGGIHDRLSEDFLFGMQMLENAGVETCDYQEFRDVVDASEYVAGQEQPWYIRFPDGSGVGCNDTISCQMTLEQLSSDGKIPKRFALQKGFPDFVGGSKANSMHVMLRPQEFLVGLFNERGLMNPCLSMQVTGNLLPGEQGISTIEGVTLRQLPFDNQLVGQTLKRLEASFKSLNYTGFVFLGIIHEFREVEDKGYNDLVPCVVDFSLTPPPGFWAAFLRGLEIRLDFWLDRVLNPRRDNTPYDWFQGWVTSRKLTVPPYPLTEAPWLTPKDRFELARQHLPPIYFAKEDWGIYWNQIARSGEGLKVVGPHVGYLVGRGVDYYASLQEIRNTTDCLQIPWRQVKVDPDPFYEFNSLGQLRYESPSVLIGRED